MNRPLFRMTAILLVVLALTGCVGRPATPEPPAPNPDQPVRQQQPASPAPSATSATGLQRLVETVSQGALVRTRFQPGEVLGRDGFYFLKVATGEVEGWLPGSEFMHEFTASPDNRWVSASDGKSRHYLADRTSGTLYRWPREAGRLIAAHGDALLFQGDDRFWLTGPDLQRWTPLSLTPANGPQGLFTADGTAAFLVNDWRVYRVAADSGKVTEISKLPSPTEEHWRRLSLSHARGGAEIVVMDAWGTYGAAPATGARLLRYAPDGAILSDQPVRAEGRLSPDGRLFAWLEGGVVVASAADLKPLFRVRGADFCTERIGGDRWLADSSGLVIRVRDGHRIITADGELRPSPALASTNALAAPSPAPDRADRFAIEAVRVVDEEGQLVSRAVAHKEGKWIGIASISPWGLRGDEVRFYLGAGGRGPRCGGFELPPLVERPPLAAQTSYQVVLPAGDCLNLRTGPAREAPVITCLPGGSRVTPRDSPGRVNKGWIESWGSEWTDPDGGASWYHVTTDQGQRGWIAFSGEYLTWAPNRPGEAEPNPLDVAIEDEVARLDYWLGVAVGEIPCTTCAWDPSFENVAIGLINRCGEPDPFARFRDVGAYDPATHDPALGRLGESCRLVRSAYERLGHPQENEAWREAFRLAREALSK